MNDNLVLFNSIVLNAFYILIKYNMISENEWLLTLAFDLDQNWIVLINMVSLGMDNRLLVMLG